jgi:predicted nucleic acid-binding protein
MTDMLAVVPSPVDEFIELGRSPVGKLYRKHILKLGEFPHPADPTRKLIIDADTIDHLMTNFADGIADIVQVPKVDSANKHSEDPDRNIGEVINLERRKDGGLDAIIDVRTTDADKVGKTLLGASAMMHMNYTDTRTGERKGPTLLHTAITNRPYITGLDDFQEIVAASADTPGDTEVVEFGQEETGMTTKEELLAALKDEHGIDVEELQARADSAPQTDGEEFAKAVMSVLQEAGVVTLSNDEGDDGETEPITTREVAEAVIELAQEKNELVGEVKSLREEREEARAKAAEAEVDGLVKAGRILPKQRDAMVQLAQKDRETFDALLPDHALVALAQEEGIETFDQPGSEKMDSEIARLAAVANGEKPDK